MKATVRSFGHHYSGDVLRETPKRVLVKYTTGTGTTREKWFGKVESLTALDQPSYSKTQPAFIHRDAV